LESIARVPTNLEKNPHITPSVPPLTAHYKPLLEPLREKRYGDLIPYLQQKVRDKGIVVREAFKDMDVHHNGFVTEAQFRRSFPFPELSQARTPARARAHTQNYDTQSKEHTGGPEYHCRQIPRPSGRRHPLPRVARAGHGRTAAVAGRQRPCALDPRPHTSREGAARVRTRSR
jgi:hypothetical protein